MKIFTKTGKFSDFNLDLSDKVLKSLKEAGVDGDSTFVRKGLTTDDIKIEEGERASIDYISTREVDRDGEIVLPKGAILDHYMLSPVNFFGHKQSSLPTGRTAWIKISEDGLIAKTIYATKEANPEGDMVFNLKKEGILTSKSIGFVPLEVIERKDFGKIVAKDFGLEQRHLDKAQRIFTKWILIEQSDVGIPSNINSVNIAIAKNMDNYLGNVCEGLDCDVQKEARLFFADLYDKSDAAVEEKGIEININVTDNEIGGSSEESGDVDPPDMSDNEGIDDKVEETEEYIHVPVRDPKLFLQNSFRAIDISIDKGIKAVVGKLATNPGGGTVVQKYLFDTSKFTEGEAVAWAEGHKDFDTDDVELKDTNFGDENNIELKEIKEDLSELKESLEQTVEYETVKNKSNDFMKSICKSFKPSTEGVDTTVNKLLDVTEIPSIPSDFNYDIFSKYLNVDVKDIFENDYSIPNMMLGTQLAGFKEVFSEFELKDERNFNWDGTESPIKYNTIQLTSKESDEFLVQGTRFYNSQEGDVIVRFYPTWSGMKVSLFTSRENSDLSKKILNDVDIWVEKNNHLKGEKITISGEFLSKSEIGWDDVILTDKNKSIVKRNTEKLKKESKSRGLLLIGEPGNGKTLSGKAIIKESNHTFIWASSEDFKDLGPISGLSLAFKMARKLAPTVLFIEDIDTWLGGYTVDLIKTEMDGLKSNDGMVTILTSNNPEKFPDALIDRPGRFHHVLDYGNPDEKQRKEMLERWAKGADEDKIEEFVSMTKGFSGAYIKELVDYAKMLMEDEDITFGKALIKSFENMVEQRELIDSIREGREPQEKDGGYFIIEDGIEKEIEIEDEIFEIEESVEKEIEIEDELIEVDEAAVEKKINELMVKQEIKKTKKSVDVAQVIKEQVNLEIAKLTGKII